MKQVVFALIFSLFYISQALAQAVISLVNTTAYTSGGADVTTFNLDIPTGVSQGDVLIAQIALRSSGAVNIPAGWNLLVSTNNGTSNRQAILYRVADGTEGLTQTFDGWGATRATGIMLAYRNVDIADPLPVFSPATGSSSTLTVNALNAPTTNMRLVVFYTTRGTTITPNVSLTSRNSAATTGNVINSNVSDEDITATGSTGTKSGTSSNTTFITHMVALRPIPTQGIIEYVGSSNTSTTNTSISISPPVAAQEGDFLLVAVNKNNNNVLSNSPGNGWTEVNQFGGNDLRTAVFWKFAGASEGSSTFTSSNSTRMSAIMLVYRNVNKKSPVVDNSGAYSNSASATAAALNPDVVETRLIAFFSGRRGSDFTFDNANGMSALDSVKFSGSGTRIGLLALDGFLNSAGSTGSRVNAITSGSTPRTAAIILSLRPEKTYFSYQNGLWTNPLSWTKDPSGTTLVPLIGEAPTPYDSVVILNGKTITLSASVTTTNIGVRINNGGVLDLLTYELPTLTGLTGVGRLRSSRTTAGVTYMPTVLYGNNTLASASGGTIEYYCAANMTLNTGVSAYFNLILRRETAGTTVYTLASNVTVGNDLTISRDGSAVSNLTFGNDGTARSLTVSRNLVLEAGCQIRPQNTAGLVTHSLSIGGDFVNNGSARFTNQSTRDYEVAANNRVIEVTFTGSTDNKLDCYGETDFYRLIIDKGIDQTYVLTVNSTDTANFRLFAPVNQANTGASDDPNPVVNKSLYLKNGTLRLKSNINIPYLTTGGNDFFVPQNACLWVDGATVYSAFSGTSNRGFTVIGRLRLSAGELNSGQSAGFVYRIDGVIQIEGGVARVTQFRRSTAGSGFRAAYIQSGGLLIVSAADETNTGFASFSLPDIDCSFTMSGGEIRIGRSVSADPARGFHLGISPLNGNVTGGLINIETTNATEFHISSTIPLFNLQVSRESSTANVVLDLPLQVKNNLTISNNGNFNANGNNLTVGGNLTINSGTTLTNGANTLNFNGTAKQQFTVNGSLTNINALTIAKPSDTVELAGSLATFTVTGAFTMNSGCVLNDNGKTLELQSVITHSGVHSGSGKIVLTTASSRNISGNGQGVFRNLELNGSVASTYTTTTNFKITGNLHFAGAQNRILDIAGNNLTFDTTATVSGANASSPVRMIRTNGNQSALGVTKIYNGLAFSFPVGTGTDYSPASISFDVAPSQYGSITLRPVNNEHPNVTENGRSLTYYWRVVATGFTLGSAKVSHTYTYPQSKVVTGTGITENAYVNARFNPTLANWVSGTSASIDSNNNVISFAGAGFETTISGDYSAGDNSPVDPFGTVIIYYSYKTGARWDSIGSWSTTGHTGIQAMPAVIPNANSVVRVGNYHQINVINNGALSGSLSVDSGAVIDIGTTTGHNFGALVGEGISGRGTIRISSAVATANFPAGDFNIFFGSEGGTVVYYRGSVNFTLPIITSQYNMLVIELNTGGASDYIDLPNLNLTILNDFKVQGSASSRARLSTNTAGNLTVNRDLLVTGAGLRLRYAGGTDRAVTIFGKLEISSGAAFDNSSEADRIHSLSVYGNVVNNGTLNLYATANRHTHLYMLGEANSAITGVNGSANTSLYLLTINKGSSKTPVMTMDVAGTVTFNANNQWLTLQNGTFRLSRNSTMDLNAAASQFAIPETAVFSLNNSSAVVNIGNSASDTADLLLRGRLELLAGTINVGNVANANNNDVEIASAGIAELFVSGGTLNVNGSIRRGLSNAAGSLYFKQNGGVINIRGQAAYGQRGKLEVINTGSYFEMTGNAEINILRGGSSSNADFYVRPDNGLVTGGTVNFAPLSAISTQNYTLDASVPIYNLAITGFNGSNLANVTLLVNNFTVLNNLTISANAAFICNDLNINVGALFTRVGTFTPGNNTVSFTSGNGATSGTFISSNAFYNLKVNAAASLNLGANVLVNNHLTIETGATLVNGNNQLDVVRDLTNQGTHTSPSNSGTNGLRLIGSSQQLISGNGTFGNIIVNNSGNIEILGNITINNQLTMTSGLVDLGDRMLTLGVNATIVSASYSTSRMIRTNGVLSDGGIKKMYPAGTLDFLFPFGILNKYTPARVNVTANSAVGEVVAKPVSSKHPSTRVAAETQLNYFWEILTTGFSGLGATLTFNYTDAEVTTSENSWRGGRFAFPNWTPIGGSAGVVNAGTNTLTFSVTGTINGGYTAGLEAEFAAVPTLYSRSAVCSTGCDWNNLNSWSEDGHDGLATNILPNGQPMVIAGTDSVYFAGNNFVAESVRLDSGSVLNMQATFGHNLGVVNGKGKIKISATASNLFVFPGGNYTAFASDTGGTVEFFGNTNGTLPATQASYYKLLFTGSSNRTQANIDVFVNGEWRMLEGVVDNTLNNKNISIKGDWINNASAAAYVPGSGKVILTNSQPQTISGNFSTTFGKLETNGSGAKNLAQNIVINQELLLVNGRLYPGNYNIEMEFTAVSGGSPAAAAMVVQNGTGRIRKKMNVTGSFTFPIGEETGTAEYSPTTVQFTTATFAGGAYVEAQVFDNVSPLCSGTSNYISRYWQFNHTGISAFAVTTSAQYLAADVVGTESAIVTKMSRPALPCIDGSLVNVGTKTLSISADLLNQLSGGEPALPEPTVQASLMVFSLITSNSMRVTVKKGNGSARLVLVKAGSAVDATPADFTAYAADSTFGDGAEIGTDNFVLYAGTDSIFPVSGLSQETIYHFAVFEFNGTGAEANYLITSPAVGNQTTFALEPTTQASAFGFTVVGTTTLNIKWTNGNGTRRLVLAKANAPVDALPTDGEAYTADASFGNGAELGTGNFAVFSSTIDSVVVTGLNMNTTYHFKVFEFNGTGGVQNYLTTSAPVADTFTYLLAAIELWLEGGWNGTNMDANLVDSLPLTQPYNQSPWNYAGSESVGSIPNADVVDWVLVELRSAGTAASATSGTVKARKAAFLLKNGQVVDLDGSSPLLMRPSEVGTFYAVIYHRTHIPAMSSAHISFSSGAYRHNYKTAVSQAYGTQSLVDLGGGQFGFYAGRVENTTPFTIDTPDRTTAWSERNKLGYQPADATLKGAIDASDRSVIWNNRGKVSQVP